LKDYTEEIFISANNKSENDESEVEKRALDTSTYSISLINMSARYFVWKLEQKLKV